MANSRRCGNNHVYDADIYAVCPYCNGQGNSIQFGATPAVTFAPGGDAGRTTAPGLSYEGGGTTMMPGRNVGGCIQPPPHRNPEDIPVTVAPGDYLENERRSGVTIGGFEKKYSVDPVVGWVVCVEGEDQGRSFSLYARVNIIGRGERATVDLKDRTVSRDQARLGYDVKHNNFFLIPGDSTNTTYLNDMPLYVPTPIAAYDLVEIGETKLMFIPFCGDRFRWNNVLQNVIPGRVIL